MIYVVEYLFHGMTEWKVRGNDHPAAYFELDRAIKERERAFKAHGMNTDYRVVQYERIENG